MQLPIRVSGLKKLLQICRKNSILKMDVLDSTAGTALHYGPLGTLLKRNIFNEWLHFLINNDFTLFPLEIASPSKPDVLLNKTSKVSACDLVTALMENYHDCLSLLGHKLPFGFLVYRLCNKNTILSGEKVLQLEDLKSCSPISLVYFCPPKKSMHWFHYWSKQRYLWWRKFSSIPAKFSLSEVTNTATDDQQLSLLLEFPWGKDELETVTLYENKFMEEITANYCKINNSTIKKDSLPSVIICETGLDLAVLAYLSNSMAEKWRDGQVKNVLQLHHKLAPYKACVLLESQDPEQRKKLLTLASHLVKELNEVGILFYPSSEKTLNLTESQFTSFDEKGIPYTIVLSETTLSTGVAGLRNRDTTLLEQVHVTELTLKLLKYLKIRS